MFLCGYCNRGLSTKYTLRDHKCKSKDDTICILERARGISQVTPENPCECRYCHRVYSRKGVLAEHVKICKSKFEYIQQLELGVEFVKPVEFVEPVEPVILNFFGNEDTTHIKLQDFKKALRESKKKYSNDPDNMYEISYTFILNFNRLLQLNPSNKNHYIKSFRDCYGEFVTSTGITLMGRHSFLEHCFKNVCKHLIKFENQIDSLVYSEIVEFGRFGFFHSYGKHHLRYFIQDYTVDLTQSKRAVKKTAQT